MDHGEKSIKIHKSSNRSRSIQVYTPPKTNICFEPTKNGRFGSDDMFLYQYIWGLFVHLFQPLLVSGGEYQLHHPRMDVLSPGKVRVGIPKFQAKRPKHCQQLGDLGVSLYSLLILRGW